MADCPPTLELQIIAVHGGAGFHPKSTDPDVKRALRLACTNAGPSSSLEHDDEAALLMTCIAISTLEDDGCLNAGYGSNLTLSGTTECDASVMDGNTGDFGAVGSVSGAGEHITRMSLARMICEAIEVAGRDEDTHDVLQRVLGRDFLRLCSERGERTPQAGVLLLVKEVRLRDDSDSSSDSGMCSDREGGKESNNHEVVCNTNNGGGEPPTTFKLKMIGQDEGGYSGWHGTGLGWPEDEENWNAPGRQPTPLRASMYTSGKVPYPRCGKNKGAAAITAGSAGDEVR
ncbi:hypothetical protein GSI_01844 [Ganoderma sinense ZZ0214-1]|uniref:Asparaginase n=1 Tax=Ganoderma sinense ZZ0214-1 TaxID=1077348 RepID=A0A2G8SR06_9APHY|nr:hypothetical protein GSI_01844 [Ganoderma sinense ZZ0214-1]